MDNNIKMDFRKVGYEGVYWIELDQHIVKYRDIINVVEHPCFM